MVRPIMKDMFFLSQPSEPATLADLPVVQDLLDTLEANADACVGMAANMIGVRKNIIVVNMGMMNVAMLNPVITKKSEEYEAVEGCLSLTGKRNATRYRKIEVEYQDLTMKKHRQTYEGWTAQIIQHEVDHLAGIII